MHAGFFDVFHDAGDEYVFAVAQSVDIDFGGIFEETIDQDWAFLRRVSHRFAHVVFDHVSAVGDDHGASAEDVAGADQDRVAEFLRDGQGAFDSRGGTAGRLRDVELLKQAAEAVTVFGEIDGVGIGADDRYAVGFQRQGQIERRLSAELHNDAVGLLGLEDVEDVLKSEGFEVQPVGRVVVSRHSLRVAVDHDGLDAHLLQRVGRVTTAIVELDSLSDAVGTGAEDHDLLAIGRLGFALFFVD